MQRVALVTLALGAFSTAARSFQAPPPEVWACQSTGVPVLPPCPVRDPAVCGQWEGPYFFDSFVDPSKDEEITDAAVVPRGPDAGKVLFWCRQIPPSLPACPPPPPQNVYFWNPQNPRFLMEHYELVENNFCGAHTWTALGDLLHVGGQDLVYTCLNQATRIEDMRGHLGVARLVPDPRAVVPEPPIGKEWFYESVTSLPDGRVLVTGTTDLLWFGTLGPPFDPDEKLRQYWSLGAGWSPIESNGFFPNEYPRRLSLQSGKVFLAQYSRQGRILDPALSGPAAWSALPNLVSSEDRAYAGCVYLYFHDGTNWVERVISLGGLWPDLTVPPLCPNSVCIFDTIEFIDSPDAPGSTWQLDPNWKLLRERGEMNAVLLPNGKIFVVGGGGHHPNPTPTIKFIYYRTPELVDPVGRTSSPMADHGHCRDGHGVAGLLPNGKVFVAGGDVELHFWWSIEIFSPPYLFAPDPPSIGTAPLQIGYTGSFQVTGTNAGSPVATVVLLRPTSTTHGNDFDQRYVELAFTFLPGNNPATGPFALDVQVPPSRGVAPPGYYMLFVVTATGTPSEARFIQVGP